MRMPITEVYADLELDTIYWVFELPQTGFKAGQKF